MSYYLTTPSKSPFYTPFSKAGLRKWFRSDVRVLSGSNLSTWTNRGLVGGDGTPSGTIPLDAAVLNGHDAFTFDGSTDVVSFDNAGPTQHFDDAAPFSMVWVFKGDTWTADGQYYSIVRLNAGSGFGWGVYYINNTGSLSTYPAVGAFRVGSGQRIMGPTTFAGYNSYHYGLLNYNGAGSNDETNYRMWLNGSEVTVAFPGGLQLATLNNVNNSLMASDGFAAGLHKWVEFAMYDSEHTEFQRNGLFAYMDRRYIL